MLEIQQQLLFLFTSLVTYLNKMIKMRQSLDSLALPYIEQGLIGTGSFSEVYKVKINGQYFALKRFREYQLKDQKTYQNALREIEIMQRLNHPNILKLYEVYRYGDKDTLQLLVQYFPKTLYNQFQEMERIPQYTAKGIIKGVVSAVKYLHSFPEPILHRDIKPENILLDINNNAKLCDFGSANLLKPDHDRTSYVGTDLYMAPEMKENRPHDQSLDLWCLGVLIYELLTGDPPKGNSLKFPDFISKPAQDLIKRILMVNPRNRLTITQIENHIWFCDNCQRIQFSRFSLSSKQQSQSQFLARITNKNEKLSQKLKKYSKALDSGKDISELRTTNSQMNISTKTSSSAKYSKQREESMREYLEKLNRIAELREQFKQLQEKQRVIKREKKQMEEFAKLESQELAQQIENMKLKIDCLKSRKSKPAYQLIQALQDVSSILDDVKNYAENIPNNFSKKILEFSEIIVEDMRLPNSEYLPKLKLQMMQYRRDALIELKCILKRRQQMPSMISIEQDYISNSTEYNGDESRYSLIEESK